MALRYGTMPAEDGKPTCVAAFGVIVAFRPGLPSPQPLFAALFLIAILVALPEVRQFAVIAIPAGIAVGLILYALRGWRQRHFPPPSAEPLGL
jgi:acid phosphatase family membrane protein YuiD